jgi:NADPH:quinone reductase-like Zn-dependent oxidoreductase
MALTSGYKVVTTCSPANFELLESLGAEKCFDYNSPTCGQEIRAYTKNSLQYAFDIITEAKSIAHCYAAIGCEGDKYVGFDVLPTKLIESLRKTVKAGWVLGLEMSGKRIALPGEYYREPNPALLQWGVDWFPRIGNLIAARKLKSHPVRVMEGGLDAVIDGLGDMREKRVSGQKMVYLVQPRDQYSLLQDTVSSNGSKSHHSSDRSPGHASSDRSSESSDRSSIRKREVIPAKQQTLVIKGPSHIILEVDRPVPKVGNHEVLIKVLYVSLNQYDAKSSDLSPVIGATPGCCFTGEVASLGSGSTENRFSIGDKVRNPHFPSSNFFASADDESYRQVCATVFGNNPDNLNGAAFAQFVAVDADFVLKIPLEYLFKLHQLSPSD